MTALKDRRVVGLLELRRWLASFIEIWMFLYLLPLSSDYRIPARSVRAFSIKSSQHDVINSHEIAGGTSGMLVIILHGLLHRYTCSLTYCVLPTDKI
jgi:hypothetical protein